MALSGARRDYFRMLVDMIPPREWRLNVAITRARVALHVLCSLGPEHIDLSKTRSQGVADLKNFLEYPQRKHPVVTVWDGV